jgi:hypothetical protein
MTSVGIHIRLLQVLTMGLSCWIAILIYAFFEAGDVKRWKFDVLLGFSDPVSCVFATTTLDHPIHLLDSTSGLVLVYLFVWVCFI